MPIQYGFTKIALRTAHPRSCPLQCPFLVEVAALPEAEDEVCVLADLPLRLERVLPPLLLLAEMQLVRIYQTKIKKKLCMYDVEEGPSRRLVL